jgi:hypothetical protein
MIIALAASTRSSRGFCRNGTFHKIAMPATAPIPAISLSHQPMNATVCDCAITPTEVMTITLISADTSGAPIIAPAIPSVLPKLDSAAPERHTRRRSHWNTSTSTTATVAIMAAGTTSVIESIDANEPSHTNGRTQSPNTTDAAAAIPLGTHGGAVAVPLISGMKIIEAA